MPPDEVIRMVDARGHRCPTPTLKLRRAIARAGAGDHVSLVCDDPMARIDVPHFLASAGADLVEMREADGLLTFVVAVR